MDLYTPRTLLIFGLLLVLALTLFQSLARRRRGHGRIRKHKHHHRRSPAYPGEPGMEDVEMPARSSGPAGPFHEASTAPTDSGGHEALVQIDESPDESPPPS